MKELLNLQKRQVIKDEYANHPLYRLLKPCKKFEAEMPHLKFSPEEVFLATIIRMEEIRDSQEDATSLIRYMWDDMMCIYRERGEGEENESSLAVCEVMCVLLLCLNTQDDAESVDWQSSIASVLLINYPDYQRVLGEIVNNSFFMTNGESELSQWVSDYLDGYEKLSDEIDQLIRDNETLSQDKGKEYPLDISQAIILYSHVFSKGVAVLDDNDASFARCLAGITPFAEDSIRIYVGRIKKKKAPYKGKIVDDALKVADLIDPLMPDIAKDIRETYTPSNPSK